MVRILTSSLTAAALAGAAPAAAATAPAQSRATIQRPLTLTRLADLEFGTIIASATTAGSVAINAVTGARTIGGGVTPLSAAPGGRAIFAGSGVGNAIVRVTLTAPAALLEQISGQTVPVVAMGLDGSPLRFTDTDGSFFVGVGGQIAVAANQAGGDYSATLMVTADYF